LHLIIPCRWKWERGVKQLFISDHWKSIRHEKHPPLKASAMKSIRHEKRLKISVRLFICLVTII
jgi:hypothetical protein